MTASARAALDALAVAATMAAAWAAGAAVLRPLRARLAVSRALLAAAGPRGPIGVVEELVGGLLLLHLLLQALDFTGVPWTRPLLLAAGLGAFAAAALVRQRDRRRTAPRAPGRHAASTLPFGLGDAAAALAVVVFAFCCWFLRSPFSDFVYHWGLKAQRFVLHHGTDLAHLESAANDYLHPDYPNLLPELYAVPALLSGRFFEPALLLLSAVFLALVALTLRAELRRQATRPSLVQAGLAALMLGIAAFCIGYYQAGSADLPFALAVLLGASALVEPRVDAAALRAGLAAAFAAALKIEGPPFAAIVLGLLLLRHGRALWRRPALLAVAGAPALAVIAPWAWLLARHDLYQPTNSAGLGALDAERLATLFAHAWRVVLLPQWHGLPLLLLALPLLLWPARSRWIAGLCGLQLGFYLYVYATAPLDPGFFVLSSFPRLVLHLVPALGLAAFAALAGDDELLVADDELLVADEPRAPAAAPD